MGRPPVIAHHPGGSCPARREAPSSGGPFRCHSSLAKRSQGMSRRLIPLLVVCGLALVLVVLAQPVPANPPGEKETPPPAPAPAAREVVKESAAPVPPGMKVATSRVVGVTVYPNSA